MLNGLVSRFLLQYIRVMLATLVHQPFLHRTVKRRSRSLFNSNNAFTSETGNETRKQEADARTLTHIKVALKVSLDDAWVQGEYGDACA